MSNKNLIIAGSATGGALVPLVICLAVKSKPVVTILLTFLGASTGGFIAYLVTNKSDKKADDVIALSNKVNANAPDLAKVTTDIRKMNQIELNTFFEVLTAMSTNKQITDPEIMKSYNAMASKYNWD